VQPRTFRNLRICPDVVDRSRNDACGMHAGLRRLPLALAVAIGATLVSTTSCGSDGVRSARDPVTNVSTPDGRGPSLRPSDRIHTGKHPRGIASGFGSLWVVNSTESTVSRVEPDSGVVSAQIRVGSRIEPIASGEGFVWVASHHGTIYKISPSSNSVVGRLRVSIYPNVVAGLRALWVVHGDQLLKVDPHSLETLDRLTIEQPVGAPPLGDSAPAIWGGSLWVPHSLSKVSSVDARTMRAREYEVGFRPRVAATPEGLWVGTYDPAEEKGTVSQIAGDGEMVAVATGKWKVDQLSVAPSSIWIRSGAEVLVRLDRQTGEARQFSIADSGYPGEIDSAFGGVWLARASSNEVWLIDEVR
jgi:streptogramin lyase